VLKFIKIYLRLQTTQPANKSTNKSREQHSQTPFEQSINIKSTAIKIGREKCSDDITINHTHCVSKNILDIFDCN